VPRTLLPIRIMRPLRLLLISVGALVALLAVPSKGWADSCSGSLPTFCTLPEGPQETSLTLSLAGLTFGANAQGMVLLYDNSAHTIVSDVVEFSNVAGVATVIFRSDLDGAAALSSGLPIIGGFTEGNPISVFVALGNGGFLKATICSDATEGGTACSSSSDSIALQQTALVPEPGTFLLTGSGVISSGLWGLRRLQLQRLLKRIKSLG
jgi:hypothetical protein